MRYFLGIFMAGTMLLVACGDDDDTGPTVPDEVTIADLVGAWDVQVWEYSLAADTSQKVDWVASIGLAGTLTVAQNGDFTVTPSVPGGFGTDNGKLTLQADSIYWDGQNDEEWVHFELTAALTIYWPEVEFVDMDQNGSPEDVYLRVVFSRP